MVNYITAIACIFGFSKEWAGYESQRHGADDHCTPVETIRVGSFDLAARTEPLVVGLEVDLPVGLASLRSSALRSFSRVLAIRWSRA